MGDIPVSKGRVLGGITRAHVASKAKWRLRAETLQARVTELETATTAREAHMQKEIARALMRERERERERALAKGQKGLCYYHRQKEDPASR